MRRRLSTLLILCVVLAQAALAAPAKKPVGIIRAWHGYNHTVLIPELARLGLTSEFLPGLLPVEDYSKYSIIYIDGWLKQSKVEVETYPADALPKLQAWIEGGGILWLHKYGLNALTDSAEGRRWLEKLTGSYGGKFADETTLLMPGHPWVAHMDKNTDVSWAGGGVRARKGELIIGRRPALANLYRLHVGKGQIVIIGWDIYGQRPSGRSKIDPAREKAWQDQALLLRNILDDLFPDTKRPTLPVKHFDNPYALPEALAQGMPTKIDPARFRTHRPTRPLPRGVNRPLPDGPKKYVDVKKGNDTLNGSEAQPFKTIQHGVDSLKPGETLVIRSGIYYENVEVNAAGTPEKPITIRAYPGELVIIDAGLREFFESPQTCWEPCPGGAAGEFRSTKTYPDLGTKSDAVNVSARFGYSLVPLQGYHWRKDMQSPSMYESVEHKTKEGDGIYCGPGVWYDAETDRIHCRLAHTDMKALGPDNYRGVTDPRSAWLIVSGGDAVPMKLRDSWHLRVQDLVLRGGHRSALSISRCGDITLDGLSVYGGSGHCASASYTQVLRVVNCSFHGPAAPWTFRGSLKYRAIESRIFSASGWHPIGNRDFELAYSEFTDSVDGVFVGNVDRVRFHHNVLHNVSDDGMFVTATASDAGEMVGGPIHIYQNYIGRCLTGFAYGVGHGRQLTRADGSIETGKGLWVYRNVFDWRQPVMYSMPKPEDTELPSYGRSGGDHGGPIWEPMWYYQNTVISHEPAWRSLYGNGWGGHMNKNTSRRLLNNIFFQETGGLNKVFTPLNEEIDIFADGNLHYSVELGPDADDPVNKVLRAWLRTEWNRYIGNHWRPKHLNPPKKEAGPPKLPGGGKKNADDDLFANVDKKKKTPPKEPPIPDWMVNDVYGDPLFVKCPANYAEPLDVQIAAKSPAVDKGVAISPEWPDPLRQADKDGPDIGALPLGAEDVRIGVFGRFSLSGVPVWNR